MDLSNRCTLGCYFCHYAYTHTRGPLAGKRDKPEHPTPGGDLMSTDLALDMLKQLACYGVKSITWAGGGEPTLHPDFDKIIEACQLDQGIYTHGGHIDEVRAALMKRKMTWCYISMDYADRESYKKAKGVDSFDKACRGARNLAQAEGRATIGLGFLLNRDNWNDINNMIALGIELDVDYIQFRPTILYSQSEPGKLAEDTGWITGCIEALEWAQSHKKVIVDIERFKMYRDWQGHGYNTCYWSALSTVITPNGKVWVCCNKREHEDGCLGDLTRESFADIWQRTKPFKVNHNCRVLCRGHIANVMLDGIMQESPHVNFI